MFFSKKKEIVGLDIGSSAIKAVGLKESRGSYTLQHFAIEMLPEDIIVDGEIMDTSYAVDTIQRLWKTHKIGVKNVACSVSGHSVIVKKISVPKMSQEDLKTSIQWEAEQYIPFEMDEVNLDYSVISETDEENPDNMAVILIACKRDKIEDYLNLISQAGLNLAVMDVDGFALNNMYEVNYADATDEDIALVDIGASMMNVIVMSRGQFQLCRDVPLGGNQYTDAIQKDMNVSFDQAENLKIGQEVEGITYDQVKGIIDSVSEDLASEVQRSLDFLKTTSAGIQVTKIHLGGGGSKIIDLDNFLATRLGVDVEIVDPFRRILYNEKKFDPSLIQEYAVNCSVTVGLALRSLREKR